jgi:sulfur relay (sulfurtransferase) DsrC/TusE family protein
MLGGETMEKEKCLQAMDFLKDWKTWRETLGDSIAAARKFGVSDETIKQMSVKMGDFLAEKVCPSTKEEELLKEMWDVATPEERKTIAGLIFKMVE